MFTITSLRHAYPEPAGFSIERKNGHEHHTFLHFFGSVELLVDGKKIKTEPHACILYPLGEPQYFLSADRLTHDWIHFTGELETLEKFGFSTNRLYYPDRPELITKLTREMETEAKSALCGQAEIIDAKLRELFVLLRRAELGETRPHVNETARETLLALRGEIFTNLKEAWSVQTMAQKACLSQSRFFFLYKCFFGTSPVEDLISARIDAAKNALTFTDASVTEIAEQTGYENLTHFIRQFKKTVGVPPSVYRKQRK